LPRLPDIWQVIARFRVEPEPTVTDPSAPSGPASPNTQLFRARALEAIDSREGLDELMTIIPSRSLYALIAIGVVLVSGLIWGIFGRVPLVERRAGVVAANGGASIVPAMADGMLISDPLPIGTSVTRGEVLARLRTAALESSPLRAPVDGTIVDVRARGFANVKRGDPVLTIEPAGASLQLVGFVEYRADPPIVPGTAARVTPIDDSGIVTTPIQGHVAIAAPEPATAARVASILGSESLAATLSSTLREVTIAIDSNSAKPAPGSPYSIVLVTGEVSPLAFLFPRGR